MEAARWQSFRRVLGYKARATAPIVQHTVVRSAVCDLKAIGCARQSAGQLPLIAIETGGYAIRTVARDHHGDRAVRPEFDNGLVAVNAILLRPSALGYQERVFGKRTVEAQPQRRQTPA